MRVIWIVVVVAACGGGGQQKSHTEAAGPPAEKKAGADPALDDAIDAQLQLLQSEKDPIALAIEHGRVAALYWQRSCPDQTLGLCVEAATPTGAHCGADAEPHLVARDRGDDASLAREHAKTAVTLWEDGGLVAGATDAQTHDAAAAIAGAELVLADAQLESAFGMSAPKGLDFQNDSQRSMQRFQSWFADYSQAGSAAREQYLKLYADKVLIDGDPEIAVIAAARIGQLQQQFAAVIGSMEVPGSIASDTEATKAYCDTLSQQAGPLEGQAAEAWKACLATASKLGVTGAYVDLCTREDAN